MSTFDDTRNEAANTPASELSVRDLSEVVADVLVKLLTAQEFDRLYNNADRAIRELAEFMGDRPTKTAEYLVMALDDRDDVDPACAGCGGVR